jgi:hypothetical protein
VIEHQASHQSPWKGTPVWFWEFSTAAEDPFD